MKKTVLLSCLAAAVSFLTACSRPDYRVCAFIWPSCHDDSLAHELLWPAGEGEWEIIRQATPRFEGHYQPKRPLLGYGHDDDPQVVEQWIQLALEHGVNTFVYDWYWFLDQPFLEGALNDGFLKAPSNRKMDFYVMWANHDVKANYWNCYKNAGDESLMFSGAVTPEQFRKIAERLISQYFHLPNYARTDGKPMFMIYDVDKFLKTYGGDEQAAAADLEWFRQRCVEEGLGGLYLQCSLWGNAIYFDRPYAEKIAGVIRRLGIDAVASYNMCGKDLDYPTYGRKAVKAWSLWQELLGDVRFYPTVSIGWDDTPRFPAKGQEDVVRFDRTPAEFGKVLSKAKDYADSLAAVQDKIVYINAWNEWVEDSYLLPDEVYGYGYLEEVEKVFGNMN
ncbi:MAG: glycoside hydrolase family 99-like domain-containing protein [Candidatus Cryptobacteroides sp.]